MIQRIQSLYLLIVTILMVVATLTPIATILVDGREVVFSPFSLTAGEEQLASLPVWLGILLILSALVPFITIFLYKRRQLQIRLCGVEAVLLLGDILLGAAYLYVLCNDVFENTTWSHLTLSFGGIVCPIVSIILVLLAGRAIFQDELLVRAADRIR